jgi:SAM-dependent methyltransferase
MTLTDQRWTAVLDLLADVLAPPRFRSVRVAGAPELATAFAGRLTARLGGRPAVVTEGAADVVVGLRERRPGAHIVEDARVIVDLTDADWPVVRHIDATLGYPGRWHDAETQAFFAVRASTWDTRFGDDGPAYARAVADLAPLPGATALDVGCGTGRALPALRDAVGPQGTVIGVDFTPQMLEAAANLGRASTAELIRADARALPLRDGAAAAVFAAGLLGHLPDVDPVLTELARVCVVDGRLALFHPSGRAALAARHGRTLRADEPLAREPLAAALSRSGWRLERYEDADNRFLALARRS